MKFLFFLILISCATPQVARVKNEDGILDRAEQHASKEGRDILVTSRGMIESHEVIRGSCWDFINAVFDRALYPANKRQTIFKSKMKGPYADEKLIQAGDWLYYVNHSYKRIDHSGVFVEWINFKKREALVMSYVGGNRNVPARYQSYKLSEVYHIIRAKP